jgi:hypothetical protein
MSSPTRLTLLSMETPPETTIGGTFIPIDGDDQAQLFQAAQSLQKLN